MEFLNHDGLFEADILSSSLNDSNDLKCPSSNTIRTIFDDFDIGTTTNKNLYNNTVNNFNHLERTSALTSI